MESSVVPLANGSSRVVVGGADGNGGTEVLAAAKLEVEDVEDGDEEEEGRVVCSVNWCVFISFFNFTVFFF